MGNRWWWNRPTGLWFALTGIFLTFSGPGGRVVAYPLFSPDLPSNQWAEFEADGFSQPVAGIVYRMKDTVTNGMALGGIDTGCLDLETSGLLGYTTIFNSHVPRRGPLNLPFLGIHVGEKTWVLCDPTQIKQGWGDYQTNPKRAEIFPNLEHLSLQGCGTAKEIRYWGHFPIVDLEYETDAPVQVGLRSWAPFFPGNSKHSCIPGIVFEVSLRNSEEDSQKGTVAFSFPGPATWEVEMPSFLRQEIAGKSSGLSVTGDLASYAVAVTGQNKESVRSGGSLGGNGEAWAAIARTLPEAGMNDPGASLAVDFELEAGQEKKIVFLLTWCSPAWNGVGYPTAKEMYAGIQGEPRRFSHMYAERYPDPTRTLEFLADQRETFLKGILSWQQVVYSDPKLPAWLKDSLINSLYLITEDSLWAQKADPLPEWVKKEDGLFGMNECPRGCPQVECIPCSFYGSLPIAYFFPDLELSTLRGYQGYQYEDGAPCWIFGGCTGNTPYIDFASPTRGYQFSTNGISLASLVDQFLLCHDTPDRDYLKEFYPMVKRSVIRTTQLRTSPEMALGERLISMPDNNEGTEWFEAAEPGWHGMTAHLATLHLAEFRIAERLATQIGDTEFAQECGSWIQQAQEAMEQRLWTGSYYLNFFEPESGIRSDLVFGYQLDGEWITDHHGLPSGLPENRVQTTLDTIRRCNISLSKHGAVNYAQPDGSPRPQAKEGTWDYGRFSYFPPEALMLGMTYLYNGHPEEGLELCRKVWHNLFCVQGYTWDMPNIMRGDVDTGERTFGNDYYQDLMIWSLPAAIAGDDLAAPCKPGGLVDRMVRAAVPQ